MNIFEKIVIIFAYYTGVFVFTRNYFKKRKSIFLLFHGTYSKNFENIPESLHFGINVAELEKVFIWIKNNNLNVISFQQYLAGDHGIVITFDDGYSNNYYYAVPLLIKYDFPAIFFVTTTHLNYGTHCTPLKNFKKIINEHNVKIDYEVGDELFYGFKPEHLLCLRDNRLITIGAHTHSHPSLIELCDKELFFEISESKKIVEKITNINLDIFSYPFGLYNNKVISLLKKLGFNYAFAVKSRKLNQPFFEIPRIGIHYSNKYYLSAKFSYI